MSVSMPLFFWCLMSEFWFLYKNKTKRKKYVLEYIAHKQAHCFRERKKWNLGVGFTLMSSDWMQNGLLTQSTSLWGQGLEKELMLKSMRESKLWTSDIHRFFWSGSLSFSFNSHFSCRFITLVISCHSYKFLVCNFLFWVFSLLRALVQIALVQGHFRKMLPISCCYLDYSNKAHSPLVLVTQFRYKKSDCKASLVY